MFQALYPSKSVFPNLQIRGGWGENCGRAHKRGMYTIKGATRGSGGSPLRGWGTAPPPSTYLPPSQNPRRVYNVNSIHHVLSKKLSKTVYFYRCF